MMSLMTMIMTTVVVTMMVMRLVLMMVRRCPITMEWFMGVAYRLSHFVATLYVAP